MKHGLHLIKTSSSSLQTRLMRFLALELIALLASILVVGLVGMLAAVVTGYMYDINHAMPNPVERGEDLGSGLIMIVAAIVSLLVSIPSSVLIHFFVFKKFLKGVEK